MVAGDVVNGAASLWAAAPANGVLVGETAYRATLAATDYAEAQPVVATGRSEPLAVWAALSARPRPAIERLSETPFVGRRQELGLLVGAFQRARHDREPQLVTVAGVPGIGKSRLVAELQGMVDADPEPIRWLRGRSLA